MSPSDYRQLTLKVNTKLGVLGDFDKILTWDSKHLITGFLNSYVVIERHHNFYTHKQGESIIWDTGIIMSLDTPLAIKNVSTGNCDRFLLIHRYPEGAWDNSDPTIHVFAIATDIDFDREPLRKDEWFSKAIWLEGTAIMTVEDPLDPSEISMLLRTRQNNKS
jgi:hypothetical protein